MSLSSQVSEEINKRHLPLIALPAVRDRVGNETAAFVDESVVWSFVSERGVLRLEASQINERDLGFDADLLSRLLNSRPLDPSLLTSVIAVLDVLEELRPGTLEHFAGARWAGTKQKLMDLGRTRDRDLFGRPIRP